MKDNYYKPWGEYPYWMKKLKKEDYSESEVMCPLINISDEGEGILIDIDMPGVNKKDIRIKTYDDSIEVSAVRKNIEEENKKEYFVCERESESYHRRFQLPVDIDPDTIYAKYEDGVLKIWADKVEENGDSIEVE